MLTHDERLRALVGNIKNWSWDVYPYLKLYKEDADVLMEHFRTLAKEDKIKYKQNIHLHCV